MIMQLLMVTIFLNGRQSVWIVLLSTGYEMAWARLGLWALNCSDGGRGREREREGVWLTTLIKSLHILTNYKQMQGWDRGNPKARTSPGPTRPKCIQLKGITRTKDRKSWQPTSKRMWASCMAYKTWKIWAKSYPYNSLMFIVKTSSDGVVWLLLAQDENRPQLLLRVVASCCFCKPPFISFYYGWF